MGGCAVARERRGSGEGAAGGAGGGASALRRLREVEERVLAARRGLAHDGEDLARLLQPPLLDAHRAQPVGRVHVVGLVLQHRAVHLGRLVQPRLLAGVPRRIPNRAAGGGHVLGV